MTYLHLMSIFLGLAGAASLFFFRKGGIYNPEATTSPVEHSLPETKPLPPKAAPEAPKATLTNLCLAIRDFEGVPGNANYRNNNPLNCKYFEGGYLPKYGNVRCSPAGFAIFPTYELGWLYGFNMLKQKIEKHPDWTLFDLIENHAPAADHNPVARYTTFVANRLGVHSFFRVKNLVLV